MRGQNLIYDWTSRGVGAEYELTAERAAASYQGVPDAAQRGRSGNERSKHGRRHSLAESSEGRMRICEMESSPDATPRRSSLEQLKAKKLLR